MSLPVPLGVRFYQIMSGVDRYVTQWVDDLSFRSVVPGGYSSANLTLRVPRGAGALSDPDPLGFSRLSDLFTRIQIVDLRTQEIAWEGRIEDPARQVEPDVWQIGALGSMVAATDIQRPVLYVDSSLDGWNGEADVWEETGTPGDSGGLTYWDNSKDQTRRMLTTKTTLNYFVFAGGAAQRYPWRWDSHGYDQPIARFGTTHDGSGPNAAQDNNFSVIVGIAANPLIDVTEFTVVGGSTKNNVIQTDFTDANTRWIGLGIRRDTGVGDYVPGATAGDTPLDAKWWNPVVLGLRLDRRGADLTTAASYTTNYVVASQVVEDVVGRFLVGGWHTALLNAPWPGSVRSSDVYIDATDTTQILDLRYPDGATAAQILNEIIEKVQADAYWAIWESAWGASNPEQDNATRSGFRFEYATWPDNWGYLASSVDGFEGQPNGEGLANFIFYRYPDTGDVNAWHVTTTWHGNEMAPELYDGGFTRAITVSKEDPTTSTAANTLRTAYLNSRKKALNAGTLTVKRPIQFYDDGANSWSGGSRMLDPWMLKPGKLIRITDLPPRTMLNDLRPQPTAPNPGIDGTIFRVVAAEYSSADNSCRLELDQPERWRLSTQIKTPSPSGFKVVK